MNTELEQITNLDVATLDTAKPLAEVFKPATDIFQKWNEKVGALTVTNISQTTEMAQARLARLELKAARVGLEKMRKGLVEGLKARTSKIDGVAREIREKIETLEEALRASEEFAERHAEKVRQELKLARETEIAPFLEQPVTTDLSALTPEQWDSTLNDAKFIRQAKLDRIAKEEADRKAKEEADRLDRERIQAENLRLKAEAEERERQAKAERERVESERMEAANKAADELKAAQEKANAEAAKLRAESEVREKIAAEQRAKDEAARAKAEREADTLRKAAAAKSKQESDRKAAEAMAARKLAAAPDADKLKAFAATVRALKVPTISNEQVNATLAEQTENFAIWIESQITKL